MKHLGLFEGIGGFSLAARWMGWETLAWCEWNEFGQKVLRYHFPEAEGFGDITKTDFTKYAGKIDILTGGFPCQPYSVAGQRKGKEDERHLWPEMLRAIREVKPKWVVGENVFGLVNWSGGLVFEEVQTDLESQGYEVQAYILPACAKNAPHRRDRIWFVAHSSSFQRNIKREKNKQCGFRGETCGNINGNVLEGTFTNTSNERLQRSKINTSVRKIWPDGNKQFARLLPSKFKEFPTQPPICGGNDGFSERLDGITFPKWRNESIKAYGNAIVPQVAFEIFKAIEQYENLTPTP